VTGTQRPKHQGPAIVIGSIVGVLLLATPATTSPWPLLLAADLIGLYWAVRAVLPRLRDQRAAATRRRAEIRERADEQHRWTLSGDARGVYGPDGAQLMRMFSPEPHPALLPPGTGEAAEVAAIAYTEQDLAVLQRERKPGWHWAVFGSVLVQRRAETQPRLRDQQLRYAPPSGVRADTEREVAHWALQLAEELSALVDQVQQVMLSPGFQGIFDGSCDENTADADTVKHTGHQLMDLHDSFLELSESCRGLTAPSWCRDLLNDLGQLLDVPLDGYREFIADFVAMMAEVPDVLRFAPGRVQLGPVLLNVKPHDRLMDRFFDRLSEMLGS
jgi:hypothetical protein